jgi:hypothetical protein
MMNEDNDRVFELMFKFASIAGSNWNFYMAVSLASVGWAAAKPLDNTAKWAFTVALLLFFTFLHFGLAKIYRGWQASIMELKKSFEENAPATEELAIYVKELRLQPIRAVLWVHVFLDVVVILLVNIL